jgi:hypothetical protein
MRLPCVQFTVRWMLAGVAVWGIVVALALVLEKRQARFLHLATEHNSQIAWTNFVHEYALGIDHRCRESWTDDRGRFFSDPKELQAAIDRNRSQNNWHISLSQKYRDAAARPWLPVEPDPPKPK